jgi:phosphoribosylamine--glycine ligase
VVLAAANYPGTPRTGDEITGLDAANAVDGVHVIHAGTKADPDNTVRSAGGRVLCVTALGPDLLAARERAYTGLAAIGLNGAQHRTDIGLAAADGRIAIPTAGIGDPS